jgi:hypothetical protein
MGGLPFMFKIRLYFGLIIKSLAAGRNDRFHHSIRATAQAALLDLRLHRGSLVGVVWKRVYALDQHFWLRLVQERQKSGYWSLAKKKRLTAPIKSTKLSLFARYLNLETAIGVRNSTQALGVHVFFSPS